MKFQFNDGGRAAAGLEGRAKDCVVRAIAIASQRPYMDVLFEIRHLSDEVHCDGSDAEHGVYKEVSRDYLQSHGWKFTPTMGIGTGCKFHLRDGELPMGRIICKVTRHLVAVIDGVIQDTHDCSRGGTRCVYGYWTKESAK